MPLEKWNALTLEEKRGFLPLCPDFVIELLSPSDFWKQGTESSKCRGERRLLKVS
uniref:Uma2 family endonuclease n=1 Tax=Dactylococcopsis salina TaxID=292566 RepID=UPI001E583D65|nr:Uma2 family endonuclease [Dactylococcopsis salina]